MGGGCKPGTGTGFHSGSSGKYGTLRRTSFFRRRFIIEGVSPDSVGGVPQGKGLLWGGPKLNLFFSFMM